MGGVPEMQTPPSCPWWCTVHSGETGWDVRAGAVTKTCRRSVECVEDVCGEAVSLVVERFAELTPQGFVSTAEPVFRVDSHSALGITAATRLAETLQHLAAMVGDRRDAAAA